MPDPANKTRQNPTDNSTRATPACKTARPRAARRPVNRHVHTPHDDAAEPEEVRAVELLGRGLAAAGGGAGEVLFSTLPGKMSTFGGPKDTGMQPDEDLAIFSREDVSDPRFADLFLPAQPHGTTGAGRRLNPEAFYVACRWNYSRTPRSLLRRAKVTVTNVATGASAEARPADWGPNAHTGRVADLSPGLARQLGLETDEKVTVTLFAPAGVAMAAHAFAAAGDVDAGPPRIYTTAEWNARPALVNSFARHLMQGIVIHNTEGANRAPFADEAKERAAAFENARAIQLGHMVNDHHWSDTGQHFTISRGGLITEGRHGSLDAAQAGYVVQGAHAGETVHNERWFGIEVAGNNNQSYQVTDAQWETLVSLCAWLMKWRDAGVLPIIGHKEVHSTSCPGHLEERLAALRTAVTALLAQLG